ncbi:acyl-CoA thioesterase [Nocardioides anomalus]|uniref:Acyl-CoA thioesterase n=1 Tax=Nocardioides anomalus TaxID=2712223 RepID=A0A6G6WIX2_9ACTN|nr:thioesterase family protein [Nocardioides anomalus]QIG45093.1 acyl-CoA thioesterase [Nocardioides anomalus]
MHHSLSFDLSYADTDPSGLVYFAAWFPWMERCQSAWFHAHGLRQDTMLAEQGFGTVTRRAECDYLAATALYDPITVTTTIAEVGRTSFTTQHDFVRDADGVLVARGRLVIVTVDPQGQAVPVPEPIRTGLGA